MTQDEIIRMAVRCQLLNASNREGLYAQALERFAALVAAHERQKMQTELLTLEKWKGIASAKFGDGRTVNEIEREAREAEREACAKAADAELMNTNMLTSYPPKSSAAWHIAAAIRQRGETK